MKIVVSSDRKIVVNAEKTESFDVIKIEYPPVGKEDFQYIISSYGNTLSYHRSETKAISELNKLAITLSADNDNLLYYMEDTK